VLESPDILNLFPRHRVAVAGDLMLDRYIWGRASRLSPEAPVPVVATERCTEVPGGAANVVRNVLGLGAVAQVFGALGDDSEGVALRALLDAGGADMAPTLVLPGRPTTLKTRVIANNQQVVRIDREDTRPVPPDVGERLAASLLAALAGRHVQGVVFEDYAKGLLSRELMQQVTDAARRQGLVTSLDPHPSHSFSVKGLTLMTPNRAEAFGLAGVYYRPGVYPIEKDDALLEVSRRLRGEWEVEYLLVTLGAGGMALFRDAEPPLHIPTVAREVFDVSGAGDTVIAACLLALAAGATPYEAAALGNCAAGVVVGKLGTATCSADELLASLTHDES